MRLLPAIKIFFLFSGVWLFVAAVVPPAARAERLPARFYTAASGLAHDRVQSVVRDSRGFLWFCTYDGLSRYDGSEFINYGVAQGLPLAYVNTIIETRGGIYWIGTNGSGVARFDANARLKDSSAPLFTTHLVGSHPASNRIDILYEDRAGNIWAGTDGGLFRLDAADLSGAFRGVSLNLESMPDARVEVHDIFEDPEGSLWLGTNAGLLRRLPDGAVLHYPIQPSQPTNYVWALFADQNNRLWLSYERGLIVIKPLPAAEAKKSYEQQRQPELWRNLYKRGAAGNGGAAESANAENTGASSLPENAGDAVWYTAADGLTSENVRHVFQTKGNGGSGEIWIGTRGGGLFHFDGSRFVNYSAEQGIDNNISAIVEDRDGNLWAGTDSNGAIKITRSGFRSFARAEGLGSDEVVSIFEDRAGANDLYVITNKWTINRFDGKNFQAVRPNLPLEIINASSGRWHIIQDHLGDWWATTRNGLYRFPKVKRLEDLARSKPIVYTTRDGLADNNISRVFEDARGDIWLASYNPPVMLTRWERATGVFHRYDEASGLPSLNWGNAFARNSSARPEDVWMALHNGGVARYRNGEFKIFKTADNDTPGIVQGIYFDGAGRLWIAASSGGAIIDNPADDEPRLSPLPVSESFGSSNLTCFVEDGQGNIYFGTARGIVKIQMESGRVLRHYSMNDGLPNGEITAAFRDRNGALWFGTRRGVARLTPPVQIQNAPPPSASNSSAAPPVFISRLLIANVDYPVSAIGQTEVGDLELGPDQNQLQINFFGLNFSAGASPKYQYLLEGLHTKWSEPGESRTFTANLEPGKYRFLVRAVGDDGSLGEPAVVRFRILPPVWLRWWFLLLTALAIAAVVYAFYRYRLKRVVEMERVRTRIATDLHDDIGASLSQIAILSEVVRQKVEANDTRRTSSEFEPLKIIASTSREMIDAMSDIVWAINPHKDNLSDLIHRMRRFASDVLEAQDIGFRFRVPPEIEDGETKDISLGADLRREIYVIFKENINNLVKHSGATAVEIEIQCERRRHFGFTIADNGRGFNVDTVTAGGSSGMGGNGLPNMRKRAAALGGTFEIASEIGKGTTVRLMIPLSDHRFKDFGF